MDRNKLADKGWGNMSSLLDIEMPIKKRKRKFFIWMLIASLLGISFVSLFYFNAEKSNDKSSNSFSEKTAIAANTIKQTHSKSDKQTSQPDQNSHSLAKAKINKANIPSESKYSDVIDLSGSTVNKPNSTKGSLSNQSNNEAETHNFDTATNYDSSTSKSTINIDNNTKPNNESVKIGEIATVGSLSKTKEIQRINVLSPIINKLNSKINITTPISNIWKPNYVVVNPKNEIYVNFQSPIADFTSNGELGWNRYLLHKKRFQVYGSLGLATNIVSKSILSKNLNSPEFEGTGFPDVNKEEDVLNYFKSIGFIAKRNYEAKLGIGLDYKFTKRLKLRNEVAYYFLLNNRKPTTTYNDITSGQFISSDFVYKNNTSILRSFHAISFEINNQFEILGGARFSLTPESKFGLSAEEIKHYSLSQIVLGCSFKF